MLVALSPAFVSDFCFKFHSVQSIGYNFHSTFHLRFRSESNSSLSKFSFLLEVSRELLQRSTLNTFFRCFQFSRCSFAQFNPVCSCIFSFVCVSHFHQFAQSFTLQWLPFFVPRGRTTQHTFGFCQLSPILKTCLVTIWPPLSLQQQLLRSNFAPTIGGTAHLVPPHRGPVCSSGDQITKA